MQLLLQARPQVCMHFVCQLTSTLSAEFRSWHADLKSMDNSAWLPKALDRSANLRAMVDHRRQIVLLPASHLADVCKSYQSSTVEVKRMQKPVSAVARVSMQQRMQLVFAGYQARFAKIGAITSGTTTACGLFIQCHSHWNESSPCHDASHVQSLSSHHSCSVWRHVRSDMLYSAGLFAGDLTYLMEDDLSTLCLPKAAHDVMLKCMQLGLCTPPIALELETAIKTSQTPIVVSCRV